MERIIVEQLRDRLYYATDTIVTYIDSRVLICNSNEFPQSLEDKAEFITTSKYYILESGDLCPCNDLYYKEDIRLFSRISFERKEEIRNLDEIGLTPAEKFKAEISDTLQRMIEKEKR